MQGNKKPRVLVTYVEAGLGHIVTAQAISDALKKKYSENFEIVDNYTLRDSNDPILNKYEKYLVSEVNKHSKYPGYCYLYFGAMYTLGTKNTLKLVHHTAFGRQTKATVKEYTRLDPDMIVCTHYYLLFAAIEYRNRVKPECRVVLYCPDNMVHGWWDNRVDMLYTNNPIATADAKRFGFPSDKVLEVFYPTRTAVTESNATKEEYREKFGIPKDKFAVVIADGVYAKAKARRVTEALLTSKIPMTVCLIAGKNDALREEFEQRTGIPENITLRVFGFLKDAPQLYAACDLFVTKAGPNAVLDSVMMGTPVIMNYYASPMEHATVRLFGNTKGCGYYITSIRKIKACVERLALSAGELSELQERCRFFDKTKNGAAQIADDIARIMGVDRIQTK